MTTGRINQIANVRSPTHAETRAEAALVTITTTAAAAFVSLRGVRNETHGDAAIQRVFKFLDPNHSRTNERSIAKETVT